MPGDFRHSLPFDLGYLNLAETFYIHPWAVAIFVVSLLLALFIPLYAIAHMLLAKAGKVQPMGTAQRVGWIVVWLAALLAIFPSIGVIQTCCPERRIRHLLRHIRKIPDIRQDRHSKKNHDQQRDRGRL